MTLEQLIAQRRERIAALTAQRTTHNEVINELRSVTAAEGDRDLTGPEAERARTARDARAAIDEQIATHQRHLDVLVAEQADEQRLNDNARQVSLTGAATAPVVDQAREQRVGGATVESEPLTYTRDTARRGVSFIQDLYNLQVRGQGFGAIGERMSRHEREMAPIVEQRAVTTTAGGSLVVPQYLPELVALPIRNGRPFANLAPETELPVEGMSITVPRVTTGLTVAAQATQNSNTSNTDTAVTDLVIPVVTAAGQQDLSRQLVERGRGVDEIIYRDLASAYAAEVDRQCLVGTGGSGTALGLQNTVGIGAATAFGAAPTAALFYSKVAGLIAGIAGLGAGVNPQVIVMHPRRWGWLSSLTDSSGRPLVTPLATGPYNATALNLSPGAYSGGGGEAGDVSRTVTVVGQIHGLPVITDANIPTNVGAASGGEDIAFVVDNTKLVLWENAGGAPESLRFDQTLGNQLTIKLVAYGYFAFTAGRYPAASAVVGGLDTTTNGMRAPSF